NFRLRGPADMFTPRASASTFSGCAYSRSIRSRTRRSLARSRSRCAAADLLLIRGDSATPGGVGTNQRAPWEGLSRAGAPRSGVGAVRAGLPVHVVGEVHQADEQRGGVRLEPPAGGDHGREAPGGHL